MSRLLMRVRTELVFALVIALTLFVVARFTRSNETVRHSEFNRDQNSASLAARSDLPPDQLDPVAGVEPSAEPSALASNADPPPVADSQPPVTNDPDSVYTRRIEEDGSHSFSVRFTTNQHGGPESTCQRPICRQLLAAIEAARASIDFAIYGVRAQTQIVNALVAAKRRGVVVRGVVDARDSDCTKFEYPDTAELLAALGADAVRCDSGPGASDIMHNKFFVFDRKKVWTGSTNISDTEIGGEYNSDVAVLFESQALASVYEEEFGEMHGGAFHRRKTDNTNHQVEVLGPTGPMRLESYFSPTDNAVESAVLPLVRGAKKSLDIAMFFFTSRPIAAELVAARGRGVAIRMVLDAGGASNRYSQHHALCDGGIEVKIENWGGKSHSKWAVADAEYSTAAVVFGSMNWTDAGDQKNDENTLYVRDQAFAKPFKAEFEREWRDLASVPVCKLVSVEGVESSRCAGGDCRAGCQSGSCCDGIDNDYDGRIDAQEEACGCHDDIDNDGDGLIDADDNDCRAHRADTGE